MDPLQTLLQPHLGKIKDWRMKKGDILVHSIRHNEDETQGFSGWVHSKSWYSEVRWKRSDGEHPSMNKWERNTFFSSLGQNVLYFASLEGRSPWPCYDTVLSKNISFVYKPRCLVKKIRKTLKCKVFGF